MARRYERDELLYLRDSPLATKPDNLPPLEEWMGPAKDSEPSAVPSRSTFAQTDNTGKRSQIGSFFDARHVSRPSNTDEFVFGPPKTSFASSSSRSFGRTVENDTGSPVLPKSDRFNLRDKFFKDKDHNTESKDNTDRDQQHFDRREFSKQGPPERGSTGNLPRKGFNRDDSEWLNDRQRTGQRRFDDLAGEKKTRRNLDDKWEGRDFRGDRDRDDFGRSDRTESKHQYSSSRAGIGSIGSGDRPPRRSTRGTGDERDEHEEEDRSAALRNREWRRGNAVPDKDWNRNNREREREKGDAKDSSFFRKHDVDPEWMYSGETGSTGTSSAQQAHTQEDFQRWKERMKAGGVKAAESGLVKDKEAANAKAKEKLTDEKVEKEVDSPKPSRPTPDPLFDNLDMDPFFSKWGGGGSGGDTSSNVAESESISAAVDDATRTNVGAPPRATTKSKSSRFASIFKPPTDLATKERDSGLSTPQLQQQSQAQISSQSAATPGDGFFAAASSAGPGTPATASPSFPSGNVHVPPPTNSATALSTTDADQIGFQRILQMLGGKRETQPQSAGPTARSSRTSSVAQSELPSSGALAGAFGGHAHAQSQPAGIELRNAGGTPAPSAPSPAISTTREPVSGATTMNAGPGPQRDISSSTPDPTRAPTQSNTEADLLLRLMQQTKISSSSPGPQQGNYAPPAPHVAGVGRPSLPPGTLPPGISLPPHLQQSQAPESPGLKTPGTGGMPLYLDDPAIAGFRGSDPAMPQMKRRDTHPRSGSGMAGPQELGYPDGVPGSSLPPPAPTGSAPPPSTSAMMAAAVQRQALVQQQQQQAQREQREREMLMRQQRERQMREAQMQPQAQQIPSPMSAASGNSGLQRPPGLEQIQPQPGGGWPANQAAVSGRHPGIGASSSQPPLPQQLGVHPPPPYPYPQAGSGPSPVSGPPPGPPPSSIPPGMIPPGLAQNPAAAARMMGLINKQQISPQGVPPPGHPHASGPPPPPGVPLPPAGIPGGPPPPGANLRGIPGPGGPGGPMLPPGHLFLPGMMPNMLPPGSLHAMALSPPPGPPPGAGSNAAPGDINPAMLPPGMNVPPPPPGFPMTPNMMPPRNLPPHAAAAAAAEGMVHPFPPQGRGDMYNRRGTGQGQFR